MTRTYNPREIMFAALKGEELKEPFYPEHLIDWNSQSAYGFSIATLDEAGKFSTKVMGTDNCFDPAARAIDETTVFNVASMTKPIAVATILRMMESAEFERYFPGGLETKLSNFYSLLERRYSELNYVKTKLRAEDPRISLKDLITHMSGIANLDASEGAKLSFESKESLAKPADGKFLELKRAIGPNGEPLTEYGQYMYTDVGYELLGMVISAIATDQAGKIVKCGEAMKNLVIGRLEMRGTFTSDEVAIDETGATIIPKKPDQKIARGYNCKYDGSEMIEARTFRRCMAASGIYSNPSDICKFASRAFSGKTFAAGGLFDKEETIALQDSFSIPQSRNTRGEAVAPNPKGNYNWHYGVGFMFHVDDEGNNKTKCHGGRTIGYSGFVGHRDGKAVCSLVVCQNLTIIFAKAKFEAEIKEGKIDDNEEAKHLRFCEINAELLANYSKEELLGALQKAKCESISGDPMSEENVAKKQGNNQRLMEQLENLKLKKRGAAALEGLEIPSSEFSPRAAISKKQNTLAK